MGSGKYAEAVEKYTQAIMSAQPSALLYANRADCLLRAERPGGAIHDCDEAINMNPDIAKALRIRGRAKKSVGDYEGARKDLSASQSIDFDEGAASDLKFVMEKVSEMEAEKAKKRIAEEEKLRKRAEETRGCHP